MKIKSIIIPVLVALIFSSQAYSMNTRTITEKNDFGGLTQESTYINGDDYYNKLGIEKSIAFYDSDKNIKQAAYYYHPAASNKKGYFKTIEYYNASQKVYSREIFHTKDFAQKENYTNHIEYFDDKGLKSQIDYLYAPEYTDKNGYFKSTITMVKGFMKEWTYYYIDSYVEKYGVYMRVDTYVTDPYGNAKITDTRFYDKDKKEVKKEK